MKQEDQNKAAEPNEVVEDVPADDATGELPELGDALAEEGAAECDEESGFSFLSSADELEGIDFGFSGASLVGSFQAGGDEGFDDDALGDDTTVLPSFEDDDDVTSVLDEGNDATTVLSDEEATSVLEEPAKREPQKKLPIPVIAGIAAVVLVVVIAVVFFGCSKEEEKAAVGYSVAYVDQDGNAVQDEEVLVGKDGEEIALTAPEPEGFELQSVEAPSDDMVSEDGTAVTLALSSGASNKVTFHYAKVVSYKVRYLNKDNKKDVSKEKTYEGKLAGDKVKAKASKVKGYTLVGDKEKTLKLTADSSKNVITFYYEKYVKPSSGGSSGGGGYSYTPSFSSSAVEI